MSQLDRAIRQADRETSFAFLSRWQFEQILDRLAEELEAELKEKIGCSGCAILYRTIDQRYRVGGSSFSRLRMEPLARYYDLATKDSRRSFTGYSARHGVVFALNEFQSSARSFRPTITHKPKAGESERGEAKSFLTVPSTRVGRPVTQVSELPASPKEAEVNSILRFNFPETGLATRAYKILSELVDLDGLFGMIGRGREKAIRPEFHGLAIADLHADLLQYRNQEIDGLDELAFHLQTLFGNCEVSIFTAHKQIAKSKEGDVFDLELSATTALSKTDQHQRFRSHFFDFKKDKSYSCTIGPGGKFKRPKDMAKTEKAYAQHPEPFKAERFTSSTRFPEHGEIRRCRSFLGIAIPPAQSASSERGLAQPYGVIRIVSRDREEFTEDDKRLATAIAQGLKYWLDLFPRNEDLEIDWASELDKHRVLHRLFGAESGTLSLQAQEQEFGWFLQKVFVQAKRISITKSYGGKSGTVVLLVKNDAGLDLILKCAQRESEWRKTIGTGHQEILAEVDNYRRFVEGKVRLNHNVIYSDLLRQSRRFVGFATSFLGSQRGDLVSLTELSKSDTVSKGRLEWVMTRTFEQLVRDVWGWWYDQARPVGPARLNMLVDTLLKDPLFDFAADMEKFDKKFNEKTEWLAKSARIMSKTPDLPKPSLIWERFQQFSKESSRKISWSETVTHGDLHGDNIFCDTIGPSVWLIDFARTDWRIDIFDLALLESDLKFRLLPNLMDDPLDDEFTDLYRRFEGDLARQEVYDNLFLPGVGTSPALAMVGKLVTDLRQLAAQGLGRTGPNWDYMVVLFLFAFKYMKVRESEGAAVLLPYHSALAILTKRFGLRLEGT